MCCIDIINAGNGYIFGNAKTVFLDSFHCTDCRNIISTEESSCITAAFKKMADTFVSLFCGMNNVRDVFGTDRNICICQCRTVSNIPVFILCFADVSDFSMTLFYKAGYDIITDLCSITDNLIIFCIQIIQTGINNILEMFFQKFQKLFITTTQNGNAVNIIAGN